MPRRPARLLMLLSGLALATGAAALTPAPTRNDRFYYEIGGAATVSPPPSRLATTSLSESFEAGIKYSCGKFDPILGISTQLNQVIDRIRALVVNALSAAIAAAPMYILERVNPGLYDLLQNLLLKAELAVNLANESCEQMERAIAAGRDPYAEWLQAAKSLTWKVEMGGGAARSSTVDVKTAQDKVEQSNGSQGLPWLEGRRAGGDGQSPIRVIGDTAVAGYNLMLNRAAGDASAPGASLAGERLVELWKTPEALRAWVNDVLGEVTVRTAEGPSNTRAGSGLLKQVSATQSEINADLTTLVAGGPPSLADLDKVSASGISITRSLIESVRDLAPIERGIVLQKLAAEIALARVVEQALLARRALLAGRREPNISASPAGAAQGVIQTTLTEMNREIDDLLFEARVRREVISETAQSVLKLEEARRARASGPTEVPASDPHAVRGGAVTVP